MLKMPAQHSCNSRPCPCSHAAKKLLPQLLTRGYLMRNKSLDNAAAFRNVPTDNLQSQFHADNSKDRIPNEEEVPVFTIESNLVHHVSGLYEKTVNGEVVPLDAVRGMSSAACHFFTATASQPSPADACHQLLTTRLLSPRALGAKHSASTDSRPECQIAEYQLQILLQAELESLVGCEEARTKKAAQIATMQSKISFMSDVATMMAFLTDNLLESLQRPLQRTFSIDLKKTFQIAVAKPKNGKAKPSSVIRTHKQQTPKKSSTSPAKRTPIKAAGSSSGRRREVQDTPAGKQRANVVWHRLDRSRRRTLTLAEVDVVGESPVKIFSASGAGCIHSYLISPTMMYMRAVRDQIAGSLVSA